ncbi:MAG: hypothetical protein ABIH23_08985 [bacterium]
MIPNHLFKPRLPTGREPAMHAGRALNTEKCWDGVGAVHRLGSPGWRGVLRDTGLDC